jgi:hypothetical protein
VKVDCVFAGDDIGDGRATLLGSRRRLLGLSLGVVLDHFGGSTGTVSLEPNDTDENIQPLGTAAREVDLRVG